MADQQDDINAFENISDEDALLQPGMLSKSQTKYLSSYNRLIKKGFLSTLTHQEYKVWRLFANTRASVDEISNELNLSSSMVAEYIQQVVSKLKEELAIEKNWKKPIEQKYTKTGFKKYLREKEIDDPVYKASRQIDKLFKDRLQIHQKEVDAFLRKHPLKRRKPDEDDFNEDN
jgi:DNA-binding CsgD family transcriptional regulator